MGINSCDELGFDLLEYALELGLYFLYDNPPGEGVISDLPSVNWWSEANHISTALSTKDYHNLVFVFAHHSIKPYETETVPEDLKTEACTH